jgi:hypothetical protein
MGPPRPSLPWACPCQPQPIVPTPVLRLSHIQWRPQSHKLQLTAPTGEPCPREMSHVNRVEGGGGRHVQGAGGLSTCKSGMSKDALVGEYDAEQRCKMHARHSNPRRNGALHDTCTGAASLPTQPNGLCKGALRVLPAAQGRAATTALGFHDNILT